VSALTEDAMRRLAFAKYMFAIGVDQSRRPIPVSASAVLMFHDAVEFFLQVASEHLNIGKQQIAFLEYWDLLAAKLPEDMAQKEAMRRLNKARVALKHHGTLPSGLDVDAFRETTFRFFEANTPLIFGIPFNRLSLSEFIAHEPTRQYLRDAQAAIVDEQVTEAALESIAIAFDEAVREAERAAAPYPYPPFPFDGQLDKFSRYRGMQDSAVVAEFQELRRVIDDTRRILKLMVMGVDIPAYIRFQSHMPELDRAMDGTYQLTFSEPPELMADLVALQSCVDFVVDVALTFQNRRHGAH